MLPKPVWPSVSQPFPASLGPSLIENSPTVADIIVRTGQRLPQTIQIDKPRLCTDYWPSNTYRTGICRVGFSAQTLLSSLIAEFSARYLCRSFGVKLLIDQGGDSPWDDKAAFKLFQASKDAGGFEIEAGLYCVE